MNISTIESIQAAISKLNCRGAIVLAIDDSNHSGKGFYKAVIKVHQGKEHLLTYLESLAKTLGQLNGEGLSTEIMLQKRMLVLQ